MRKLYPFGWIDRDLKDLGFLRDMSASAAKLYVLYVLAGGIEGRSCYSTKALREATGLANATIHRARQELIDMRLITTQKEMIHGHKNKKPKVWVELQDLPVDRLEIKQRREKAQHAVISRRSRLSLDCARDRPAAKKHTYTMPSWMRLGAERLRRKRETHV
ncbi:hypothetical protein ACFL0T_06690 [Candidatus Omnitrophota bacterium]